MDSVSLKFWSWHHFYGDCIQAEEEKVQLFLKIYFNHPSFMVLMQQHRTYTAIIIITKADEHADEQISTHLQQQLTNCQH